ncbi:hypothetical protein DFH08DRAFT_225708 [Mycena albidolilacea]|uniref:Membrane protein BRI3 n=1 Tax=Mycena albidolilacea TaxID=1033008 RepID=A0AAD7EPM0_9AGAR|nr:hypothetical protein DFH08DRAFT_225708 [Mycena albidolilacea]
MPAASSTDNKTTPAYNPPVDAQGPPVYSGPPAGPYQQPQQAYQQQSPPQSYAPQQGYAPQPTPQTHPSQMSAQQVGEQYRAQLFAQCAQGIHQPTTKYGVCGIITAVVCFPIGLICLFVDTEQKCDRCGIKLS